MAGPLELPEVLAAVVAALPPGGAARRTFRQLGTLRERRSHGDENNDSIDQRSCFMGSLCRRAANEAVSVVRVSSHGFICAAAAAAATDCHHARVMPWVSRRHRRMMRAVSLHALSMACKSEALTSHLGGPSGCVSTGRAARRCQNIA